MDKIYKGQTENGSWEEFTASSVEDAKPENSGYEKVIDVSTGEQVN